MQDTERKYFNMEVEPLLNTPEMREIQWKKLEKALQFHYEKVPFDRKRMDEAGIKPKDIRSFEDYAAAIPMMRQADFRKVIEECDMDMMKAFHHLFGDERMKTLIMITSTSGTTGIPTPYPVWSQTPEVMGELFGRIGWRIGFRPGDRLAIGFGLSMHGAGVPQSYWWRKIPNLAVIPIGAEAGTERLLHFMKIYKANLLDCTPSLALHLIERAPELIGAPVKSLGLKTLMCGAEPGAGIPEVRKRLEDEYGARLYDAGAGFGCSCDHPEYQGMHWIADDHCYYELVDPDTLKPVPMEHGAKGLAIFTELEPRGSIFFPTPRFTLNDIHQVFTEPCPCGRSGFRYKIVGRADDMLKVKGVPVYPAAIQGVINGFVPRVTGAFRIVLEVPPPRVIPPLKLKVEYGESVQESDLRALEKEIQEKMKAINKIRPEIMWLKPNTLERALKKTQLLEKAYDEK